MTAFMSTPRSACLGISFAVLAMNHAVAAVSYTGSSYSQDFNSLASSGTNNPWTNDTTIPGWYLFRQPAPGTAITTYNAGTGSSNAGSFYSFTTGSGDQALGSVGSGGNPWGSPSNNAVAGWIALALTNATGSTIGSFTLNYDGEQWRDGGATSPAVSVAQTMTAEYGIGDTFETVATWNPAGAAFDFTSPTFGVTTASALDGNDPANRIAGIGGTIDGITWNVNETLWFRWIEKNDPGNDHALAIDNVTFSASPGGGGQPGDFDGDGDVDGRDFLIWQRGETIPSLDPGLLNDWQTHYGIGTLGAFGSVPEPSSIALVGLALGVIVCGRKR